MSKKQHSLVLAVDIGISSLKFVQIVTDREGQLRLTGCGHVPIGRRGDPAATLDELATALLSLRQQQKNLGSDAICALSADSMIIRTLSLKAASREELEYQIYFEMENQLPYDLSEVYLDYQIQGEQVENQPLGVLIAGTRRGIVDQLKESFKEGGFCLKAVDADCFALFNSFEYNYQPGAGDRTILVNIGASTTTVTVVDGGSIMFARSLAAGGDTVTRYLEQYLHCGSEAAELLKQKEITALERHQADAIKKGYELLAREVNKNLEYHSFDKKGYRVLLSGAACLWGEIPGIFEAATGLTTERLDCFRRIALGAGDVRDDLQQKLDLSARFAVGIGLGIRGALC